MNCPPFLILFYARNNWKQSRIFSNDKTIVALYYGKVTEKAKQLPNTTIAKVGFCLGDRLVKLKIGWEKTRECIRPVAVIGTYWAFVYLTVSGGNLEFYVSPHIKRAA